MCFLLFQLFPFSSTVLFSLPLVLFLFQEKVANRPNTNYSICLNNSYTVLHVFSDCSYSTSLYSRRDRKPPICGQRHVTVVINGANMEKRVFKQLLCSKAEYALADAECLVFSTRPICGQIKL